ncbi:hypothetical protein GCM10010376_79370 [Streptomyces violaceusniger]
MADACSSRTSLVGEAGGAMRQPCPWDTTGELRVPAAWVIAIVMIAYAARTLDRYEPRRPVRWQA